MRTHRLRGTLAVVGLSVLAVAAVAPSTSAQDPITMQMWGRNVDEKVYNALVEQFNATHTNQIELTIIPSADYVARVATAASGGRAARPARRGPHLHARLHQPGPVPAHHRPGQRATPTRPT